MDDSVILATPGKGRKRNARSDKMEEDSKQTNKFQAFILITDDIVDDSQLRRGVPCWYKNGNVGLEAISDSVMLQGGMYTLLKRHFSKHHYYLPTLELFHDVTMKTVMGQTLDGLSTLDGKPNFDRFTMNNYNSIVKYKSTSYTYEFPIALAMYLANVYDKETHRQAKTIVGEMGVFFQVRDDFLDCFGDAKDTGKKGNDIREGKCSWLAVVALQRANPTQRKVMEEYYGKSDPEAINIIKRLYEELNLPKTFSIYEEETFKILRTNIQQLSKGLPHKLFFKLMEGLYGSKCLE